ncbi:CHASE3 domain-containing protein [Methylocystis sp. SB2]|uniref:CHASE3 domain-containing protein n=1 Tax=Methylocystis sp. (strain SB2) TaxID=743836 RepID=UPI0003FE28B7|nr:CHASE3 domain-containing protein [Methylocystis sp. SB2]ULO25058.1 CHASE3 domain-containing protein [Methylocystis sp. SB2]
MSWAIFGCLIAAIGGAAISLQRQVAAQTWVEHTLYVRTALLQTLSTLQDAETGQRGFLLTGDEIFLEPFRNADRTIGERLGALERTILDNEVQMQRLKRLRSVVADRLAALQKRIQERGAMPDATLADRLKVGKRLMDEARGIIAEMLADEERLLTTRNAEMRWTVTSTQIGVAGALLSAALLGWATLKDRQRQVAELQTANVALRIALKQAAEQSERRERVESQLRQAQKMQAVGQLTGGLAHDFNNMLAVIVGCLNLLKRKMARGEIDKDSLIDKAMECVDRAAALTHRLLAFSRQQPLTPQTVDANKLVGGMAEMIRRTLGESISVETVLASGVWRIHVDPNQLESAILNLAVNARDAMNDEGKVTIETSNAYIDDNYAREHAEVKEGQYVLVAVSDSGTGMPPEIIAQAFEPFFTTKGPGKGTGLGLSQVFGFVKQSGGHIKIYSEIGQGTTVKIYLPRFVGEGEVAGPRREPSAAGMAFRGSPETLILVVEDEDRMRSIAVAMFQDLGYSVLAAGSAVEALALINANPDIDLLFTDIVMPDMNGRALAEEALRRRPDLKVVFTTGFSRNAVIHNGVLDRGVNFLPKPFSIEQLAQKVGAVLGVMETT